MQFINALLKFLLALATFGLSAQALSTPGRHVVPLNRQQVPVQGEDDTVSYKSVYFGTVSVGHPRQNFTVVFDTGSGHVIVPSQECKSETCLIHNRYDRKHSKTAVDVDYDGTLVKPGQPRDQVTVAFGTGEVTGQFANERLCLGSKGESTAPTSAAATAAAVAGYSEPLFLVQSGDTDLNAHQSASSKPVANAAKLSRAAAVANLSSALNCVDVRIVMATEMSEEPFYAFAFDGVFGLGLDSLALAPEFSFFDMMAKQKPLKHPSFGVFLADSDDELSEISFGGHSPEKLASALTWAAVASPEHGYWQVKISAVRIGNRTLDYCQDGQCRAVVDTGTSLLAVPQDFMPDLQHELEGPLRDPSPSQDGRSTDCRRAEGVPLHFDVEGGSTITLLPGDYSREALKMEDEFGAEFKGQKQDAVSSGASASGAGTTGESATNAPKPKCQPTMMPLDLPEPLGPKLFIWGEPVLRKYYTVYDSKHMQIGFALAKHSPDADAAASAETKVPPGRGLLFA
eukprot:TRINITY_DN72599_c0_g1_i1.p1 TRINITY_DN72599_c0_g1~~TRINITY_DN72599_c0_g1_i1.p1  ORF type:complete len:514 (-),score=86.63 TRINITY_DN72599_c0_g1_i1:135-1676(-)